MIEPKTQLSPNIAGYWDWYKAMIGLKCWNLIRRLMEISMMTTRWLQSINLMIGCRTLLILPSNLIGSRDFCWNSGIFEFCWNCMEFWVISRMRKHSLGGNSLPTSEGDISPKTARSQWDCVESMMHQRYIILLSLLALCSQFNIISRQDTFIGEDSDHEVTTSWRQPSGN